MNLAWLMNPAGNPFNFGVASKRVATRVMP